MSIGGKSDFFQKRESPHAETRAARAGNSRPNKEEEHGIVSTSNNPLSRLEMASNSKKSSRNIIPSSGAIHTTNAEKRRTFYYSSLIIDNGTKNSNARWKVHLGDIVAIAKSTSNQSTQEVIESWKPNHYVKKSPGWRIGLVIALRKVITRHGVGRDACGGDGVGGINFECHVQWLEKALDLDKDEMKSANLKSIYRPYNTNSNVGSQLPHVLVNCPGDYGVVSMKVTSQAYGEFNIILPLVITMKTHQNFMRNGVKEGEESKYELQFCCTKTRRQLHHPHKIVEGARVLPGAKTILNEREPDAWVHLNRPGANENSDNMNGNVAPLINKIPGPLQQAWKGWLQIESSVGHTIGDSINSDVRESSFEEKSDVEEKISRLRDALMRGWSQSRRERSNKLILAREEQRRMKLEDTSKVNRDPPVDHGAKKNRTGAIVSARYAKEKRTKIHDAPKLNSSATKVVSSTKRESNNRSHSDAAAKNTNAKRRKKELRFSADTKQPSSKPIRTSETSISQLQNKKRSRGNTSQQRRTSSSTTMSENIINYSDNMESSKRTQRKKSKGAKIEGIKEDEAASITTRDTHSTDTTLLTRGAGREKKLKMKPKVGLHDDETKTSMPTTIIRTSTSVKDGTVSPSDVSDALAKWEVDSTFSRRSVAYCNKENKNYFRELRMVIPLTDPSVRCLFDEDEVGILDQYHSRGDGPICQQFHIQVGSVVAVHYKESVSTTNSWSPFRVPWGAAQVINIFRESEVDNEDGSWKVTIKWFYRYPELERGRRAKTLESMNKIDGLVETFETCDCSVEELLPAYIDLTSETEEFARRSRQEQGDNGYPIVRMICQHLELSRGKMRRQSDWTYNYRNFLQSLPSCLEDTLPGPYERALNKMPARLKKKFDRWFEDSSYQRTHGLGGESLDPCLDIVPETTVAPVDQGGMKYFDSIDMNVQKTELHSLLRAKFCNRWTLAVGHIIAVHPQHDGVGKMKGKSRAWYPFRKKWRPAQIIALYKKECGKWMMEIRWFDRFEDILQQHKVDLTHLDKPYVVFETEVYEHVPVAAALPGRVILTSIENRQSWDTKISDTTGIPLIPRLCSHFCFDEEIDTCMDWQNYDLDLLGIPPGLSRGLSLRPRNRQKKNSISILYRYYSKTIKSRVTDPDHNFFKTWSEHRNHFTPKNKSICTRFVADDSIVELGPHLLTVNLQSVSLDFLRSVTIRSPTTYFVSPTMEMKRRKKNVFECMIGDIVCYHDLDASTSESYTSAQQLNFPWYPFQIPWSYGQILTIYKESTKCGHGEIKIEVRRFYRLSEVSEEAKVFLPLDSDVNQEIFESNDITIALDARCILGTAKLYLGNHSSAGNEDVCRGRRKEIVSCRCNFFYLRTYQRLQPIYWSSLFPVGWHQGLQQRGYENSSFVKKYKELRQVLVKSPDKGLICDMIHSGEISQKEGSCVRRGKQIQSSSSQRTFYSEIELHPQWSLFCASEFLSLADTSERKLWKLNVGDIVAVKDPEPAHGSTSFPFLISWYPGQILSMFEESNTNGLNSVHVEIRFLELETSSGTPRRKVNICYPSKIVTVTSSSLLGPLVIHFSNTNSETDLRGIQTHLPLSEYMAANSLKIDSESAIKLSELYTTEDMKKLGQLVSTKFENIRPGKSSSLNSEASNTSENDTCEYQSLDKPFRIDELNLRAFYKEMILNPRYKIFRGGKYEPNSTQRTLKIGDTVRVRIEGSKRFPYDCNWGIAEVVAVFKEVSSKVKLDQEQQLNSNECRQKSLKIEVRWLYERDDISMSVSFTGDRSELIEVFETDHCQVMEASNTVLDHVQLVENNADVRKGDTEYFLCTRFWSTKRRSLIPCSGLNGRIQRGLIYSTLGLNTLSAFKNDVISLNENSKNWKNSMANLISKLTLKDASKDAYASGEALVGREREMTQLLAFFRGAFFQDRKSAGYKSSMFLAGPPGVVSHSDYQIGILCPTIVV